MDRGRASRKRRARRATAHHEAGHAVMAWALGLTVKSVSIRRKGTEAGRVEIDVPRWVSRGARKLQADDVGREQPLPVNDLIDIGVFAGSGLGQRPLYLEKRRLTQGETTFEIEVGERPTTAGIDPYNKLVDRRSDDNTITVTKR